MTVFLLGLLASIIAVGFFLCILGVICAVILSGRISRREEDDLSAIEGFRSPIITNPADHSPSP